MLLDYPPIQFHHSIHDVPFLHVIFICWIATGNETGIHSDILGDSLDICGTIISSLTWSPRSPRTKELLSVIIQYLIVYRNWHDKIVLHDTPLPIARDNMNGFVFTMKGVLEFITAVTYTPTFPCSLYFPSQVIFTF